MNLVGVLNIIFYSVLVIAFVREGSSFNLARHGLEFSWQTIAVGSIYYAALCVYLTLHNRRGRIALDAYNVFVILFSVLIVPGVVATSEMGDGYNPHYAMLFSGMIFLLAGIVFEILSARTTSLYHVVEFDRRLSKHTAVVFMSAYIVCVVVVLASGNMNRAGVFDVIQGLLSADNSVQHNTVAAYRAEVYHASSNILSVIGNYAGGVFGAFFALILFNHFYQDWRVSRRFSSMLVGVAIISFPIIFALGTGSRLMLLRTLLIYFVFFVLPLGLKLLNWKLLQKVALAFAILIISTTLLGRGIQGDNVGENLVIQTEKSVKRLFLVKGKATMWVYEYYPRVEKFEAGVPIAERLSGFEIDGEPSIAKKIYSYLYNGNLGTAGPQTFGDFYASFGYSGQIALAFPLAFFLLWLRRVYVKALHKNVLDRAFWAFLTVSFGYLGYSDFGSFKAIGFVYLFIAYLIMNFFLVGPKRSRALSVRNNGNMNSSSAVERRNIQSTQFSSQ